MIHEFQGQYRWLSNFWRCEVPYEGIVYPSSEHAYVASKTLNMDQRQHIASLDTSGQAKRYGRKLALRPDWEEVKIMVMCEVVEAKFRNNPELADKLVATGDQLLQEGNRWGDTFWGVDLRTGKGENHLGRTLMTVRTVLRKERS